MTTPNRRRADRIEVGIPAQLYTRRGFVAAEVRDISRVGLRLRTRAHALGLPPTDDLHLTSRMVHHALAPAFALDLDYERYGPLMQRTVKLVRVGMPSEDAGSVELCCSFEEPLGEDEAALLQTSLPDLKDTVEVWQEEEPEEQVCSGMLTMRSEEEFVEAPGAPEPDPVPAPALPPKRPPRIQPRQRYRALVTGTRTDAPPAFFCHTDLVTAVGVRICLPRRHAGRGPARLLQDLIKSHGKIVDLRILGERGDIWSGTARLTGVELPTRDLDRMLVTLAYGTPLSMSDLRGLGLLADVA